MTPECVFCHLARREREDYARYERRLADKPARCTTCRVETYWLVGAKRPPRSKVA